MVFKMLIEFSVENFRSIKEQVTLSMVATKDKELEGNTIKRVLKNDSLLRTVAVYGANASGKTNVLLAMRALKMMVLNSHKKQKGEGLKSVECGRFEMRMAPFKLDKRCRSKPTKMSVVFMKNKIMYHYKMSFNDKRVVDESLIHYPKNKKAVMFQRNATSEFRFVSDKKKQKAISERTLPETLYVSKAAQDNYRGVSQAFDWFADGIDVLLATDNPYLSHVTLNLLRENKESKKQVLKALAETDVGIDDVSILKKKLSHEDFNDVSAEAIEEIFKGKTEKDFHKIQTYHKGVAFDFEEEESRGTKKIFGLIGVWIDALRSGKTLLVDEIDTKLHHFLNLFLIRLFNDPAQNKKNAQLIFTTHDVNLLSQTLFRRDQIWFTEKHPDKCSTDLYSLAEYGPRKDENVKRGYLAGKYGAIPFIKEDGIF